MPDVRNTALALTLTGQELVDRLGRGDDARALELVEHAQELAEAITEQLSPDYDYDAA